MAAQKGTQPVESVDGKNRLSFFSSFDDKDSIWYGQLGSAEEGWELAIAYANAGDLEMKGNTYRDNTMLIPHFRRWS